MNPQRVTTGVLIILCLLLLSAGIASAQDPSTQEVAGNIGTAFTYQGHLNVDGTPANGDYDFEFRLYDMPTGGTQVGNTVTVQNVPVQEGVFSIDLDFGDGVFDGSARWLALAVRSGNATGAFTPLDPRQEMKPTPYALSLPNVYTDEIAPFVGIGREKRITGAEFFGVHAPVGADSYGGMYVDTENVAGKPFYGYATRGSARVWHYYNPSSEQWVLHNGGPRLAVDADGAVGIGTQDPDARLTVHESGNQDGIHVVDAGDDGLFVEHAGGDALFVDRAQDDGLHINRVGDNGIQIGYSGGSDAIPKNGISINEPGKDGLHVNNAANYGVYATSTAPDDEGAGVYGESSSEDGVGVVGTGGWIGVAGYVDGGYGVYATGTTGVYGVGSTTGVQAIGSGDHGIGIDASGTIIGLLAQGGEKGILARTNEDTGVAIRATHWGGSGTSHIIEACSSFNCSSGPNFRVQRDGEVYADGSFHGDGADYADLLPLDGTTADFSPGDVMAIGSDGKLVLASEVRATSVIGVYSTQPGFVGDLRSTLTGAQPHDADYVSAVAQTQSEETSAPIALAGIVPVNASAENGPIMPGDLLTVASLPGHAARAEGVIVNDVEFYPPGTILGKALEGLDSGTGTIQMVVMLR